MYVLFPIPAHPTINTTSVLVLSPISNLPVPAGTWVVSNAALILPTPKTLSTHVDILSSVSCGLSAIRPLQSDTKHLINTLVRSNFSKCPLRYCTLVFFNAIRQVILCHNSNVINVTIGYINLNASVSG